MRDVACAGYVAGCNTRWFATPAEGGTMSMEAAQDNLQARLSFANDDTDRYASMLAFPCWEGQFNSGQLDTVMRCARSPHRPPPPACRRTDRTLRARST